MAGSVNLILIRVSSLFLNNIGIKKVVLENSFFNRNVNVIIIKVTMQNNRKFI